MSTPVDAGSQTATLATEHILSASSPFNTAGTYMLKVNVTNLANGEQLTLRMYSKLAAADAAAVLAYTAVFANAQTEVLKVSIPLPIITSAAAKFTLQQDGGTGRAFPWSIETL